MPIFDSRGLFIASDVFLLKNAYFLLKLERLAKIDFNRQVKMAENAKIETLFSKHFSKLTLMNISGKN